MVTNLPLFLPIKQDQRSGSSSLQSSGRLAAEEAPLCCSASIRSYLSCRKTVSELSQWRSFLSAAGREGSKRIPRHWKYLNLEMPLGMERHTLLISPLTWQDRVLTGQSSDRLNSGGWNLIPANGHGKWETEPVFSVSQSTRVRKGALAEFSPSGEYRSLSEPGDSPVCIPSPLL